MADNEDDIAKKAEVAKSALENANATSRELAENLQKGQDSMAKMAESGQKAVNATKEAGENVIGALKGAIDTVFDTKKLTDFLSGVSEDVQKAVGELYNLTFDAGVSVGVDSESVQRAIGTITGSFLNLQGTIDASKFLSFSAIGEGLQLAVDKINPVEKSILKFDSAGLEVFGEFAPASQDVDNLASSLTSLSNVYRAAVAGSAGLGVSADESSVALRSLAENSDLTIDELGALASSADNASDKISGFTRAQQLMAATGLEVSKVGRLLNMEMNSLGVSATEALDVFSAMINVQSGTGLSINKITDDVTTAASSFRYYGNNIQEVSVIYKQLLDGLGSGRANIAGEIFQTMTQHVSQLGLEMKAFLGMTSNIGGGAGALESALRLDEALASGEGLDDVIKSVFSNIERLSNAPLMTRREALDTNRVQEYYVQQSLQEQMLGVRGQQSELLAQAYRSGKTITREDLAPQVDSSMMAAEADRRLDITQGVMTRRMKGAQTMADLEGSEGLSNRLLELGASVGVAGVEVNRSILALGAGIRSTAEAVFSSSSIEDMKKKAEERFARMASEKGAAQERGDFESKLEALFSQVAKGDVGTENAANLLTQVGVGPLMDVGVRDAGPIDVALSRKLGLRGDLGLSAPEVKEAGVSNAIGFNAIEAKELGIGTQLNSPNSYVIQDISRKLREDIDKTSELVRQTQSNPSVNQSINAVLAGSAQRNEAAPDSNQPQRQKEEKAKMAVELEVRLQDGGMLKLTPGKVFNVAETE